MARQLRGDGSNELFHMHAGKGGSAGNGKSSFFRVLEATLGAHISPFDVSELTTKV